jgi:hypothetical protein
MRFRLSQLRHPIVQAPLGGGPSTPALAAAVSAFVSVSEREIARAVGDYDAPGIRVEGSAAASLAAFRNLASVAEPLVLIVTGRNIDHDLHRRCVEDPDSFPDWARAVTSRAASLQQSCPAARRERSIQALQRLARISRRYDRIEGPQPWTETPGTRWVRRRPRRVRGLGRQRQFCGSQVADGGVAPHMARA